MTVCKESWKMVSRMSVLLIVKMYIWLGFGDARMS